MNTHYAESALEPTHEVGAQSLSRVRLFVTPWTVAPQAPLSTGFPRQESWSGLPRPPPGDLPNPGIEPVSQVYLHWQVGSLPLASPWASLVAQLVKNPPAMQETLVQFLGQEDLLEKGQATHSSILGTTS